MMLTHVDETGQPRMVDVGDKAVTERTALARCVVSLPQVVWDALHEGDIRTKKGPVFQTAIIAGTMAVKRTSDLIPLCHPLPVDGCRVTIAPDAADRSLVVECWVRVTHKTGVEMEALTGASVAALTVYDMCKALSHEMVIRDLRLVEKHGGKRDIVGGVAQ